MKRWAALLAAALCFASLPAWAETPDPKHQSYIAKVESELDAWGAKLHSVQQRSERAGQNSRAALKKRARQLEARMQAARQRLEQLKNATESQWQSALARVERAMRGLRQSDEKTKERKKP
jgi:hypothetical protein